MADFPFPTPLSNQRRKMMVWKTRCVLFFKLLICNINVTHARNPLTGTKNENKIANDMKKTTQNKTSFLHLSSEAGKRAEDGPRSSKIRHIELTEKKPL